MSQVAVDQVLASTRTLVSNVLSGILDDIRAEVPSAIMQLLENKFDRINTSLFQRLSSAALQKKYFKKYFNLVVSQQALSMDQNDALIHVVLGTCDYSAWYSTQMEKEKD